MSELNLWCSRPHVKDVNFETSRFVVSSGSGLKLGDVCLEMGDEIPPGSLSAYALRCEYDATRRIELLSFALTLPHLREACARRGVKTFVEEPPKPKMFVPDLKGLSREELADICTQHGLSTHGTSKQLRNRITTLLAG